MEITTEVLEKMRAKFRAHNFQSLLGIEIDSIENGRAQIAINVEEKHLQQQGIVHGGVIATLVDTAVAIAIIGASEPGARFTTVELKSTTSLPFARGVSSPMPGSCEMAVRSSSPNAMS